MNQYVDYIASEGNETRIIKAIPVCPCDQALLRKKRHNTGNFSDKTKAAFQTLGTTQGSINQDLEDQ